MSEERKKFRMAEILRSLLARGKKAGSEAEGIADASGRLEEALARIGEMESTRRQLGIGTLAGAILAASPWGSSLGASGYLKPFDPDLDLALIARAATLMPASDVLNELTVEPFGVGSNIGDAISLDTSRSLAERAEILHNLGSSVGRVRSNLVNHLGYVSRYAPRLLELQRSGKLKGSAAANEFAVTVAENPELMNGVLESSLGMRTELDTRSENLFAEERAGRSRPKDLPEEHEDLPEEHQLLESTLQEMELRVVNDSLGTKRYKITFSGVMTSATEKDKNYLTKNANQEVINIVKYQVVKCFT